MTSVFFGFTVNLQLDPSVNQSTINLNFGGLGRQNEVYLELR